MGTIASPEIPSIEMTASYLRLDPLEVRDFSYSELRTLLGGFGYEEIATGRTAGPRVAFLNRQTLHVIRLHRPHPSNLVKRYQLDLVEDELRNQGAIP